MHAIGDVVLHGEAPLAKAALPELTAIAGRAAEIHLQHGIAAIGEELHLGVEAPAVARPGAAVRVDDHGQLVLARLVSERQRQIAVNRQAIAAGVLHRLHVGHVGLGDRGIGLAQQRECVARGVVQVALAGRAIVHRGHDEQGFRLVVGLQVDFVSGQLGVQLCVDAARQVVEEMQMLLVGLVDGGGQDLALVRVAHAVEIDLIVGEHDLLIVRLGGIDAHERHLVASARAVEVQATVVEIEEGRTHTSAEIGFDDRAEFFGFRVAV